MREDYSLETFRNAKQDDLPSDEKRKLENYDAFVQRTLQSAKDIETRLERGELGSARFAVLTVLESLSPQNLHYYVLPQFAGRGGYKEHWALQRKYAETKKGQLEMAQEEAEKYDERYEALIKDVRDKARAYDASVAQLQRFVTEYLS